MAVPITDSIDTARPLLFQPFKVRGLMLKNRLVVPPMVHYRAGPGSTCGMFHNVHLGRYALGARCCISHSASTPGERCYAKAA